MSGKTEKKDENAEALRQKSPRAFLHGLTSFLHRIAAVDREKKTIIMIISPVGEAY